MSGFAGLSKVRAEMIGDVPRIIDAKGNDITRTLEGCERIAEIWNALRHVAFPENHLNATEDYVKRLEQLRKDAVARADAMESSAPASGEAA